MVGFLSSQLQIDKLRNRLRSFENGNLPKIPQELLEVFPQNLPRHDFSLVERLWNQLTSNEGQDAVTVSVVSSHRYKFFLKKSRDMAFTHLLWAELRQEEQ